MRHTGDGVVVACEDVSRGSACSPSGGLGEIAATATDAGLLPLVIQLGRARAATMDVAAVLGSVCSAVTGALGLGGALLVLLEPPEGVRALTASDTRAGWFGDVQQRAGMGPLPGAVRVWRPMVTADLARIGPPTVAAAAAECGLVSSLVLPLESDGERVGVLQLLGEVQRPVDPGHAEALQPLLEVLAARLADVTAWHRATSSAAADRPAPAERPAADGHPAPAERPASGGRPAADERPASPVPRRGRSRRGAHAAPEPGADPSEETTHALPAVSPRPHPAPAPASTTSRADPPRPAAPRPPAAPPRTGPHSA